MNVIKFRSMLLLHLPTSLSTFRGGEEEGFFYFILCRNMAVVAELYSTYHIPRLRKSYNNYTLGKKWKARDLVKRIDRAYIRGFLSFFL